LTGAPTRSPVQRKRIEKRAANQEPSIPGLLRPGGNGCAVGQSRLSPKPLVGDVQKGTRLRLGPYAFDDMAHIALGSVEAGRVVAGRRDRNTKAVNGFGRSERPGMSGKIKK